MRYLLVDEYHSRNNGDDTTQIFDTLDGLRVEIQERYQDYYRGDDYGFDEWSRGLSAYEIGETIPVRVNRTVAVTVGEPSNIPAPLPGETVSDYARRITGG